MILLAQKDLIPDTSVVKIYAQAVKNIFEKDLNDIVERDILKNDVEIEKVYVKEQVKIKKEEMNVKVLIRKHIFFIIKNNIVVGNVEAEANLINKPVVVVD